MSLAAKTPCQRSVEQFRDRDFAVWRGLPEGCEPAQVELVLSRLVDGEAVGSLGQGRAARFRILQAPGYPKHIRAWYDGARLLALEAASPQLHRPLAETLSGWGDPDAKLNFSRDVLEYKKAEWVYASRGFSAAVHPETQAVMRIVVFAPVPLERYIAELRPPSGTREHPE